MAAVGWWMLIALAQAPGAGDQAAPDFQPRDLIVRESDTGRPPKRLGPEEARHDLRLLE